MGDCRGAEELLESANYDNLFNQSFQFMKTTAEVSFVTATPSSLALLLAFLSLSLPPDPDSISLLILLQGQQQLQALANAMRECFAPFVSAADR